MRCVDCCYFERITGTPICNAGKRPKRFSPGDEEKDLPCEKGKVKNEQN